MESRSSLIPTRSIPSKSPLKRQKVRTCSILMHVICLRESSKLSAGTLLLRLFSLVILTSSVINHPAPTIIHNSLVKFSLTPGSAHIDQVALATVGGLHKENDKC